EGTCRHDADGFQSFIAVERFPERIALELYVIKTCHRLGPILEFWEVKEHEELVVRVAHPSKTHSLRFKVGLDAEEGGVPVFHLLPACGLQNNFRNAQLGKLTSRLHERLTCDGLCHS